jgi:hypothetical protein
MFLLPSKNIKLKFLNRKQQWRNSMLSQITSNVYSSTADAYNGLSLSSANQTLQKVGKVAIPAVALIVAVNMPTAEAGPITEVACYAACAAAACTPWGFFTFPAWMDKCLTVCTLTGFLPTP